MPNLTKWLFVVCMILLFSGMTLSTATAYTYSFQGQKYYGSNYPQSYSTLTRENFLASKQYGSGTASSGLVQGNGFVRNAYGSNYPDTSTTVRFSKKEYGSNYPQTTAFLGSSGMIVKKGYGSRYGQSTAFAGSNGMMVKNGYGTRYGQNYATYDSSSDFYDPYYDPRDRRSGWKYIRTPKFVGYTDRNLPLCDEDMVNRKYYCW